MDYHDVAEALVRKIEEAIREAHIAGWKAAERAIVQSFLYDSEATVHMLRERAAAGSEWEEEAVSTALGPAMDRAIRLLCDFGTEDDAWHRLAESSPALFLVAARRRLDEQKTEIDRLRGEVERIEGRLSFISGYLGCSDEGEEEEAISRLRAEHDTARAEAKGLSGIVAVVREHLYMSIPTFEDERVSYVETQIGVDDYRALVELRETLDGEGQIVEEAESRYTEKEIREAVGTATLSDAATEGFIRRLRANRAKAQEASDE